MTTLAKLTVDLEGNSAHLIADMARAQKAVQSAGAQMNLALGKLERGFSTVRAGLAALATGMLVGGTARFLRENLEAAGGLGELAEQIGTTTDNLQVYQALALQSGLSSEQLQNGVAKLTRTIEDASRGNDEAIAGFKRLGLGVLDAGGKVRTTDDMLRAIMDRLAGVKDANERAGIAVALFGDKLGQKLLPFLAEGEAGLRRARRELQQFGVMLDKEGIAKADQAADAMAKLNYEWERLKQAVTIKFSPDVSRFLDNLRAFLVTGGTESQRIKDLEQIIAAAERGVSAGDDSSATQRKLAKYRAELAELKANAQELERLRARTPGALESPAAGTNPPTKKQATEAEAASKAHEKLLRDLALEREALTGSAQATEIATVLKRAHAGATEAQIARLTEEAMATAQLKAEMTAAAAVSAQMLDEAKKQDAARAANAKAMLDQSNASIKLRLDLDDEIAANQALIEALGRGRDAYETLRIEQGLLSDARAKGVVMTGAEAAEYANTLYRQRKSIDDVTAAQDNLKAAGMDAFHAIGTAAENAVVNFTSLRDVLSGLAQDMLRILYRLAVTKPLETALQGALSGAGGFFGLFGGGASATPGATPYAAYTMGPHFAEGTMSAPGGWALVGEKGPELVNLPRGAQVRPNDETMEMLSGGGRGGAPTINFNFSTGLTQSVRAELVSMMPMIRAAAVEAVVGARARDPRLFRSA